MNRLAPMPGRAVLPPIPVIDARDGGVLALVDAARDRATNLLDTGWRHYGERVIRFGDPLSARWLERTANPYRGEIAAMAARLGRPGVSLLNLAYEWSCTSGVAADPAGIGSRLLRTVDWPMDGLGRNLVLALFKGAAGDYYSATWPGFVGVLTAMAPGRFAVALNQPPMRRHGLPYFVDWAISRLRVWTRGGLPPVHLLRRAMETCRDYAQARDMLAATPLCLPAFYVLAGARGEGCVIERTESEAVVHEAPFCIANHWLVLKESGGPRSYDSQGRRTAMQPLLEAEGLESLAWLAPPILNDGTRQAAVMNAATGTFILKGFDADGSATPTLSL